MRPEEITALGELAGEAAGGLTQQIGETHAAIAQRTFDAIGPVSLPVELIHDGIAGMVYGTVGDLSRHGIRAAAAVIGGAVSTEAPALEERAGGRRLLAALGGMAGDRLHAAGSALDLRTTLRRDGRPIQPVPEVLAASYPDATPRLALLVHGLGQTEAAWSRGGGEALYGQRLRELGITPLFVRLNSGRPIAENGRELAELIERMLDAWPVAVGDITLIGHALGALVCHSAGELAAGQAWAEKVRQVIALGAPHRGTALEKLMRATGTALNLLPETRAAGRALELRSAGLKEAGQGSESPFLPTARYLFISGSVFRDPESGLGRWLGDLLVSRDSAWAHPGAGSPVHFPVDSYRHIGGVSHFSLTSHPLVAAQMCDWLAGGQLPVVAGALPSGPQGSI